MYLFYHDKMTEQKLIVQWPYLGDIALKPAGQPNVSVSVNENLHVCNTQLLHERKFAQKIITLCLWPSAAEAKYRCSPNISLTAVSWKARIPSKMSTLAPYMEVDFSSRRWVTKL